MLRHVPPLLMLVYPKTHRQHIDVGRKGKVKNKKDLVVISSFICSQAGYVNVIVLSSGTSD